MSKKKVDRLEHVASKPMAGPAMFYFDGVMVPADKVFAKISPEEVKKILDITISTCLLYTSPSPRDRQKSRMPSSA